MRFSVSCKQLVKGKSIAAIPVLVALSALAWAGPATDLTGTWVITMTQGTITPGDSGGQPEGVTVPDCQWDGTLDLTQTNGNLSGSLNVSLSAGDTGCVGTISGNLSGTTTVMGAEEAQPSASPNSLSQISFSLNDMGVDFTFLGDASGPDSLIGSWSASIGVVAASVAPAGPVPPVGGAWNANRLRAPEPVPTLSEWALILLTALLMLFGIWRINRQIPGHAV